MTSRVIGVLTVSALGVALPSRATALQAGTVEISGFTRYTNFDNSLGMGTGVGVGGRATVYLKPSLAFELDVGRTSSRSITYTPIHLRAVFDSPVGPRVAALVGFGYVRNWYGAPVDESDGGPSVLLGLRYQVSNQLWVRLGGDLDVMFHTASGSPFDFYTGNWGLQLGVGTRVRS
jgi:hypothetical protein